MNKGIEKLKSFTAEELCTILFPVIKDIYNSYNYIDISEKKYKNLVLSLMEKCQREFSSEEVLDFSAYFSIELRRCINDLVKELLTNGDNFLHIVNSYIEKNIKKGSSRIDMRAEFDKLSHFFISVNYYPNIDEYTNLINNNEVIRYLLKMVVNRNYGAIKTNKLNTVFDSDVSINLIKDYCNINGIAFYNEKANYGDDEFYNSFSVKIEDKDYTDDSLKLYGNQLYFPLLTIEEEEELGIKSANGDVRAREILIERNLRYVISVAKEYISSGIEILDLIQAGNIGLIRAVDKYDINKGCRLLTYADYFIRQEIDRSIAYMRYKFKIPNREYGYVKKYEYAIAILEKQNEGRFPSVSEIAETINMTEQEVKEFDFWTKFPKKYERLIKNEGYLESLVTSFENLPEEIVEKKNLQEQFRKYILKLTLDDRDLSILKGLWGIFDSEYKSGVELGELFNVTKERIRQREAKIFKKIRERSDINPFASYLDEEEESIKRLNQYRNLYKNGGAGPYLNDEFFESIGISNRGNKRKK